MLVLSRYIGELLVIDFSLMTDAELLALRRTPIDISLVDIRRDADRARLGIEAPRAVQIHRKEIWDTIQRDGMKAEYAQKRHEQMVAVGGVPSPR